jgi:hypothetical protein
MPDVRLQGRGPVQRRTLVQVTIPAEPTKTSK